MNLMLNSTVISSEFTISVFIENQATSVSLDFTISNFNFSSF